MCCSTLGRARALENLKTICAYGWRWLCRLKSNLVNPDKLGNVAIEEVEIPAEGRVVHLKGYGMVRVFTDGVANRRKNKDGGAEHHHYWATEDLRMSEETRQELERQGWGIETYQRGLKQCCGLERAQARSGRAQKNHLGLALRAFLGLEAHRLRKGVSWYEAKLGIVREAICFYLGRPLYTPCI